MLGVEPTKAWMKGDVGPTSGMRRRENTWQVSSRLPKDVDLELQVEDVLAQIRPAADKIRGLPFQVCSAIKCAFYVYGPEQPPFHVKAQAISEIAAIGAEFDVDLYQFPD